jgi:hypothetical protein
MTRLQEMMRTCEQCVNPCGPRSNLDLVHFMWTTFAYRHTKQLLTQTNHTRGKPEGKRPLGRPRHRWEDLQEVGGDCGKWMERAQDRDRWRTLVNTVMNFRVP